MARRRQKPTTTWGKIWYFIWYDNSVWSWLVNVILAFILIKFIIYPGLGALLGTTLPIVAVVSESMDHHYTSTYAETTKCEHIGYKLCGDIRATRPTDIQNFNHYWEHCGDWYEERGITSQEFKEFPFKNGFSKGDIIILTGKKPEKVDVGDVIVFQATKKPYPIIHRVVNKTYEDEWVYQTKGDHNPQQISDERSLNELHVSEEQLLGTALARIPLLGWVKIGMVELFQGKSC